MPNPPTIRNAPLGARCMGLTAQLIANDSRLRSLCLLAGERHLVVPAENDKAFRRGLREMGYAWGAGAVRILRFVGLMAQAEYNVCEGCGAIHE